MNKTIKKLTIICTILFCIKSFSQRKYTVKAKSGLIIREQPTTKSNRLEKLPYNYKFQVDEKSVNRKDTIVENGYKIAGNWVPVEKETTKGFVFDGFMEREYDTESYGLYGKVKSVKKYSYYVSNKEKIKNHIYVKFNKVGKKSHSYDYKNGWKLKEEYLYNNKNQLISRRYYDNLYKYKYDKRGNQIESQYFDKNQLKYKYTDTYDAIGNKVSYEYYDAKKNKSQKFFFIYNSANKWIESTHYNYDGTLESKYLNEYKNDTILIKKYIIDSKNNKRLIGERTFKDSLNYTIDKDIEYFRKESKYNKGKIYTSKEKIFNENNELIKLTIYESADSQFPNIGLSGMGGNYNERTIYKYKEGELVSEKMYRELYFNGKEKEVLVNESYYKQNYCNEINHSHYSDFKEVYRTEYFYDYNNNLIKSIEYEMNNLEKAQTTEKFIYTFDNHGNWIEKQVFKNGKLYEVYKQEFEYY